MKTSSFAGTGASKLQLQAPLAATAGCDSHSLSPSSPCLVTPEPSLLCTVLPRYGSSCALLQAAAPAGGSDRGSPERTTAPAAAADSAPEVLPGRAVATPNQSNADANTPAALSPPQLPVPQHRSPLAPRQAHSCGSSAGAAKPCRSAAAMSASSGLVGMHYGSSAALPGRTQSHMSSPESEEVSSAPRGYHSYASTPSRRLPWRASVNGGLAAAAFTNPLFDVSRSTLPSPLNQGHSIGSLRGTAASSSLCASAFASPTHHHSSYLCQHQLQAQLHNRHTRLHHLGRRDQDPRVKHPGDPFDLPHTAQAHQSRRPGWAGSQGLGAGSAAAGAAAAAKNISATTLAATLPLLRGMGRRSQRDQGALVGALALLLGVGAVEQEPDELDQDDVYASSGYSSDVGSALEFGDVRWRHMGGGAARARVSSAGDLSSCAPIAGMAGRKSAAGTAAVIPSAAAPAAEHEGGGVADATAETSGSAAIVGADSAGLGATLELLRYAASLQQQLAARNRDMMSLRLQLEESYTAREEMGAQLLSYQQHIIDLERRLEQEKRGRAGLAVQSQLLQQELQEASEVWRDVHELARVQSQTAATPMSRAFRGQSLGDAAAAAAESGGGEQPDLHDAALEALRRENESLTSRLIASSLMAAEAVEREEEARHQVHILQELNAGAMQSVNALSLELSLLRSNAGNARSRRFNLPWGSSSGGSGRDTSGGGGQ
ncbi:hypothetical protein HYH02_002394 [Chlamydomonas schloesseri]|uniref:Uncharacterized protein n=1 Tax=Chlamydomonas schloesseri TaxID=2026947 RepID=A0A835WUQ1_9CHLO|nr:hypothetical protein HYH02_002394 [Chlamydomonas schloesseri]|eukprot:KAG2453061.1 hypothetical protein HYH02_002394 [Chlamydomonas schloesseri]